MPPKTEAKFAQGGADSRDKGVKNAGRMAGMGQVQLGKSKTDNPSGKGRDNLPPKK